MLTTPSILGYLAFLIAETFFYIYLAVSYQKRMHEDSWDSNVPAEKYILVALWVGAVFYCILTATNLHTVITLTGWATLHSIVTIMNGIKRSLTLGVTVLLCSGRSLSKGLVLCVAGYAATYVGISKYVSYQRHNDPFQRKPIYIVYVWPTAVDLLIYGYAMYMLQQTMRTLEFTNQTRKLHRYTMLRNLLGVVLCFLLFKQLFMFFADMGPIEAELDQAAFFFTLAGIGYLWQPSPANRDFENVVEMQPADLDMESPLVHSQMQDEE